ncbi:MAG TPA: 23S rRNA (adenine(2503)-C(2))-methyltransferase RlmN [Bacteroidales bacterium]|nr:23S rRNA (adenine(2503)-C(2))-methyltransferase RlmN [Bacteroidales bacterium]HPS15807.1 23S rRNA (adenine(2503)-C(2))-methyltransferase RlmN [Bacteroidales bacterium]
MTNTSEINKKQDIRFLSQEELKNFFIEKNEKAFRAKQVWEWLWKKSAHSFDEMTNVSLATREMLRENFIFETAKPEIINISKDKTIKTAFRFRNEHIAEGVLIPAENRMTACVSSQVGCSLGCKFCATGKLGFTRNLLFDEIYDQVAIIGKQAQEHYQHHLTNIVFMGMGEPLLNYENLLKAIDRITSPDGLNMSPSRITVSTVGLVKMIKKLGDDNVKFNLALSLHAANDKKRNQIIPANEQNSMSKLAEALKYFYEKTGTRITLEYLILDRFNDSIADAKELAEFCKNFPCKINIIEYNPIAGSEFGKSREISVKGFAGYLETKNLIVNIRKSRGEDIDAACGQLAGKLKNKS